MFLHNNFYAKEESPSLGSGGIREQGIAHTELVLPDGVNLDREQLWKSRLAELHELKAAIQQEQAVLGELQSKTWGLELVNYQDGTRGIILPRGTKVDRTGTVQDGSGRIGVIIKP